MDFIPHAVEIFDLTVEIVGSWRVSNVQITNRDNLESECSRAIDLLSPPDKTFLFCWWLYS
jgi:hypothetical protein